MAVKKGREMLVYTGAFGSATLIATVQTTSFSLNNEAVDITNKDSSGWRTLLDGAGTKSATISFTGVFDDVASAETVRGYAFANSINTFTLVFNSDGTTGDTVEGSFQVTGYERAGDHNNEENYSVTIESSGALTYTADQTLSGI